jgi:hypothetical protein
MENPSMGRGRLGGQGALLLLFTTMSNNFLKLFPHADEMVFHRRQMDGRQHLYVKDFKTGEQEHANKGFRSQ